MPTWTTNSTSTLNTAGSWDTNVALADGETAVFNDIGTGGVTHHASYTSLANVTFHLKSGYTGTWGAEATGTTPAAPCQFGSVDPTNRTTFLIGAGGGGRTGNGSGRILLRNVADGTNIASMHVYVHKTGSATNNYAPLGLSGPALRVWAQGGETGVAQRPGETATLDSLMMTRSADDSTTPVVRLGAGVSLPGGSGTNSIFVEAGELYNRSSNTAAAVLVGGSDAEYYVEEDCTGAHTNIDIEEGKVFYDGTGSITNVTARAGVTFRRRSGQALGAFTIEAYRGCTIDLRNGNPGGYTGAITINCRDGVGSFSLLADAGVDINLR